MAGSLTAKTLATIMALPIAVVRASSKECPACRVGEPPWEALVKARLAPAFTLDCDREPGIADRWRIKYTPTVLVFKAGRVVAKVEGLEKLISGSGSTYAELLKRVLPPAGR